MFCPSGSAPELESCEPMIEPRMSDSSVARVPDVTFIWWSTSFGPRGTGLPALHRLAGAVAISGVEAVNTSNEVYLCSPEYSSGVTIIAEPSIVEIYK